VLAMAILVAAVVGIQVTTHALTQNIARIFAGLFENIARTETSTEVAPVGSKVLYAGDSVGVIANVAHVSLDGEAQVVLLASLDSHADTSARIKAAVSPRVTNREAPIVVELISSVPDTTQYQGYGTIWIVSQGRSIPWFVKK